MLLPQGRSRYDGARLTKETHGTPQKLFSLFTRPRARPRTLRVVRAEGLAKDTGIAKLAAQIGALYDEAYDASSVDRNRGPHDDVYGGACHNAAAVPVVRCTLTPKACA